MRLSSRFVAALAFVPIAACSFSAKGASGTLVPESGSGGTRTFAAKGFTSVGLAGPDDVKVTVGPQFAIRAEGDPAVLDKLELRRDGDDLNIGRKPHTSSRNEAHKVTIYVSMPSIAGASIAGSGDMRVDRAVGRAFDASMAGSGTLQVAQVRVPSAEVAIAGSGRIVAAGQADKLTISIAGSGDLDAPQLRTGNATVSIMGSGSANAQVNGPASVTIMGSGDADLGPHAHCNVTKMGSGNVRCGG